MDRSRKEGKERMKCVGVVLPAAYLALLFPKKVRRKKDTNAQTQTKMFLFVASFSNHSYKNLV